MPSLKDFFLGRNLKPKRDMQAHFTEQQWINPKLDWKQGTARLRQLFPRDTRAERPRRWYEVLQATHWPDCVIPGNGPFFVPDSVLGYATKEEADEIRDGLKKAGFKMRTIPVAIVPSTGEYIREAMMIAGKRAWNVDPVLYHAYWYPGVSGKAALRNYNTARWRIEGGE